MLHPTVRAAARGVCHAFLLAGAVTYLSACADRSPTTPLRLATQHALRDCDGTEIIACDTTMTSAGANPPTGGLVVPGWPSFENCYYSTNDSNANGVDDACEDAVAAAFAPMLVVNTDEATYVPALGLYGGEYFYAVHRYNNAGLAGLEIAYLPAYYVDLGTDTHFDVAHDGDSEFIMVDVTNFQGKWVFTRAFLSAHCGSTELFGTISTAPNCQWFNADNWDQRGLYVDNIPHGAPYIWDSRQKHANYYSFTACQGAQYGFERCDGPQAYTRFPVTPGFNVGSSAAPANTNVVARRGTTWTLPGATENMWSGSSFRGWRPPPYSGDMPTPYGNILRQFGF